jgi:hypothetical protein
MLSPTVCSIVVVVVVVCVVMNVEQTARVCATCIDKRHVTTASNCSNPTAKA